MNAASDEPGRHPVAGLLLTGGASRRMGVAKATMVVGGQPLAARLAGLLVAVCAGPVVEVGPGYTELDAVVEEEQGGGPLVAVAAGAGELDRRGWDGPAVVLSCDLPNLDRAAVELLAGAGGSGAVVPAPGGRSQPLCARWSPADLRASRRLADRGQRSLRGLPAPQAARVLRPADWLPVAGIHCFSDADTPEDLARLAPPPIG